VHGGGHLLHLADALERGDAAERLDSARNELQDLIERMSSREQEARETGLADLKAEVADHAKALADQASALEKQREDMRSSTAATRRDLARLLRSVADDLETDG